VLHLGADERHLRRSVHDAALRRRRQCDPIRDDANAFVWHLILVAQRLRCPLGVRDNKGRGVADATLERECGACAQRGEARRRTIRVRVLKVVTRDVERDDTWNRADEVGAQQHAVLRVRVQHVERLVLAPQESPRHEALCQLGAQWLEVEVQAREPGNLRGEDSTRASRGRSRSTSRASTSGCSTSERAAQVQVHRRVPADVLVDKESAQR